MARTTGARNSDYEDRRWALARRLRPTLFSDGGLEASLRELAVAAGTSVSTLKHYFHDRTGMISAVLESQRIDAAPYIAMSAIPTHTDLRASLQAYVVRLRQAWFTHGAGNVYARTLAAGLASTAIGPSYVNSILEPLLQSVEQLLRAHIQRGELAPCDERFAALEFLSPLVLGLLHQDSLSGKSCRPLNLDAFIERHLDVFVAGHPAPAPPRRARG